MKHLLLLALVVGCAPATAERTADALVISKEQQASWVRNFNPFLPGDLARWPTQAGVYEPLMIHNAMTGEDTPWLATSWTWLEGNRGVEFVVRDGVRWSDGTSFSAGDVLFTFELVRKHPGLDVYGLNEFVSAVERSGNRVIVRFDEPYVPGLGQVALQPIVPEHIWSTVEDPATFANPDPVGTGPFTQVQRFENQIFELAKNPHYWQPGKPAVPALRFPALPSNEQATLALMQGEIDWAGNFVPAIERTYGARDPQHHTWWFPAVEGAIYLYPNTSKPPLDDARVRKALSLTIDRQLLVDVAAYGYTEPAPPSGLAAGYQRWMDGPIDTDWIGHDPAKAAVLLDEAGFALGEDGKRRGPDGEVLTLQLSAVSGWSDWVRGLQVIAQGLRDVGVDATIRNYDFGAWFGRLQRGEFDLSLGWTADGPTPHGLFRALLSAETVEPVGTTANVNWHRFGHPGAEAHLQVLEQSTDRAAQKTAATALQGIFAEHAPAIPVFLNPSWGIANTRLFTGFPSQADPWARLSPNHHPESLLVLTDLRPRSLE